MKTETKIVTVEWIEERWIVQAYWKRDILREAKEKGKKVKVEIGYDFPMGSYIRRMEIA